MNQIPPFTLWLGNANDCRDLPLISDTEIQHVVQLAIEETVPHLPREVNLFRLPISDASDNDPFTLRFAISSVAELVGSQRRTLVCCSAGLSRSPATAACALALANNRHPNDCLTDIGKIMHTDVSPGLWQDLLSAHSSLVSE